MSTWWRWVIYVLSRVLMANIVSSSDLASYYIRMKEEGWLGEYGPLANLYVLVVIALTKPDTHIQYLLGAKAIALMLDAALVHAVMRKSAWKSAAYIVGSAALYSFWLDRLDLFIGALLVVTVLVRAPWAVAAASLVKFPLLGAAAVPWLRSRAREDAMKAAMAGAMFLAGLVVTMAWRGVDAALMPFTFHGARTPQMEGLVGCVLALLGVAGMPFSVAVDHGAAHVHGAMDAAMDGALRALGLLVFVAGVGATAWRIWRAGTSLSTEKALLLAMIAYTLFNPVGSGQFLVVIVMLLPWCADDDDTRLLGMCTASAACAGIAFLLYPRPIALDDVFLAWTLMRNLLLMGAWLRLMRSEAPAPPS